MTGKIGLGAMLLAVAVLVLAESSSYGGHRRRGNCGSCGTACASGGCETAAVEASPSDAKAPAAPPAPAKGAAVSPPVEAPQVAKSAASGPSNQTYYTTRRAPRAAPPQSPRTP